MYAIRSYYGLVHQSEWTAHEDALPIGEDVEDPLGQRQAAVIPAVGAAFAEMTGQFGPDQAAIKDVAGGAAAGSDFEPPNQPVITSYSIHYTKLYDKEKPSPFQGRVP